MKKTIILTLSLFAMLFSCDNYLDVVPDDTATIDDAFDDRNSALSYLMTCYSWMPQLGNPTKNPAILGSDETAYKSSQYNAIDVLALVSMHEIALGGQSAGASYADYWAGKNSAGGSYGVNSLYKGIRDCNIFLEKIDLVPGMDADEKSRWIAEVKFLKAYYHFYIYRMYGPIILVKENVPVDAGTDDFEQFRSPIEECTSYIAGLFNEAAADLPLTIADRTLELGRVTRVAALAMRAKTLVWAASPLFNGNTDGATIIDSRGTKLFPAYDETRWQTAANACKAAIDAADEAGVVLYEYNVADVPRPTGVNSPDDVPRELLRVITLNQALAERWTDEKIFVSTAGLAGTTLQRLGLAAASESLKSAGIYSQFSPPLHIAEQFYTKNGVPINEDTVWDYDARYELRTYDAATDEDIDANGVADNLYYVKDGETTINLHFDREPRFYASLGFDRGIWYGNPPATGNVNPGWTDNFLKMYAGEYSSGGGARRNTTGYVARKVAKYNTSIKNNATSISSYTFPEMRLAGLYLFYAECLNEVGNQALAIEYLDKVREHAGLKGVVESWTNYSSNPSKPNSKSGLREIIQTERLNELAFEGQRFWDTRRWKTAVALQTQSQMGWNTEGETADAFFTPVLLSKSTFSFRNNLFPIPTDELLDNPNLVQNPGW
ncbi:MAG: RagB/SusD family nutrient uptake outer membrane protein [Flavobacteriaceae bacterium]